MLHVETVDDIVEHQEPDAVIESFSHRKEQRDGERVQMRLAEYAVRRLPGRPVELNAQLKALCLPSFQGDGADALFRMQVAVKIRRR